MIVAQDSSMKMDWISLTTWRAIYKFDLHNDEIVIWLKPEEISSTI
jgi:hypothetical protein